MPEYRRVYVEGGTYFITMVTFDRGPIFNNALARKILHDAWNNVTKRFPFITNAFCLLPDHIHTIITLPDSDANYSMRIREIKRIFSRFYCAEDPSQVPRSASRNRKHEATIWQRRFWEHTLMDENDYYHHIDYIHYNPVKHGLVEKVSEWPWSSFHRYVRMGFYDMAWGNNYSYPKKSNHYGDV